jgi:hypothetical protein
MSKASGWAILWKDTQLNGYTDYFVAGSLNRPTESLSHLVTGPRGWRGLAKCKVDVDGLRTNLDYRPFAVENKRAGMDNGSMTIVFSKDRKAIKSVSWQYPGKRIRPVRVLASIATPPSVPPYQPNKGKLRRPASVVVRGPQGQFRILVRAAYGDRCVLTGCAITEALEAVHIDPYENSSQHNPKNGLLLRKDLHALFDRTLIAVNPRTMRVEIAPSVRLYAGYSELHRKARLRAPETGYESYGPEPSALGSRWEQWKRRTGAG